MSKKCRGYENAKAVTIGEVPQGVFALLPLLVGKFGGSSNSSNGIAKERKRVLTTSLKDMTNSQKVDCLYDCDWKDVCWLSFVRIVQ